MGYVFDAIRLPDSMVPVPYWDSKQFKSLSGARAWIQREYAYCGSVTFGGWQASAAGLGIMLAECGDRVVGVIVRIQEGR